MEQIPMRRKDRARDEAFAWVVLDQAPYATLALATEEGGAYCVPISPVREGEMVYFHCALRGYKLDLLRARPQVCLSAVSRVREVPEKYTASYASAIAFGTAQVVEDEAEKVHALGLLARRYAPEHLHLFEEEVRRHGRAAAVVKIQVQQITGKENPEPM